LQKAELLTLRRQAALTTMKDVYFDKPQVFEAKPGVPLGRYIIRRALKA
jgi:hypothetical protein